MIIADSVSQFDVLLHILKLHATAIGILAAVCALVLVVVWHRRGVPSRLFGPQRWPAIPWQLPEVFLASATLLVLVDLLLGMTTLARTKLEPTAYQGYLVSAAYGALLGPFDGGLAAGVSSIAGTLTAYPADLSRKINDARTLMIGQVILFPFLIYLVVHMMNRLVGAKPYQMGLHLNRWRENVTLGCLGWLLATIAVVIVYGVVRLEFWETLWGRPTSHPVADLLLRDQSVSTWILAALITCVIAPVKEELLLRGIVQPYLIRWPVASDLLIVFSLSWAIMNLLAPGGGPSQGQGLGPLLFVFTVAPGYFFFERLTQNWFPEPGVARGIFATSLLFASIHAGAWPSPIPIFVLSVFLGSLAHRTGSLVGPITLHCLFNATGMIVSLLQNVARW